MTTISTINPNNPPANTPVASSVMRANFLAAYSDINALWQAIFNVAPPIRMGNFFWGTPSNMTISLIPYAEYSFTIVGLNRLVTTSGTITLSMLINGTPVSGLNALAVTNVAQNPLATANNSLGPGDELTITLASNAAASNLKFTMKAQV